jgi:hypothetical protein
MSALAELLTKHSPAEVFALILGEVAMLEGFAGPDLGGPFVERASLASYQLATLGKNALLATEELEALRLAYRKKKTASARR